MNTVSFDDVGELSNHIQPQFGLIREPLRNPQVLLGLQACLKPLGAMDLASYTVKQPSAVAFEVSC